jgi:ketosteroid isomerase-like protein
MPRQNTKIVRRAIEAFNEGDLDTALRDLDREVGVDWSRSRGVEAGVYRGFEAVRGFWATFIDTFESVAISPDEFIECDDVVVVPNRGRFRGRDGIEVAARSVGVVTLRHGKIVRWCLYQEPVEALEAVGLAE